MLTSHIEAFVNAVCTGKTNETPKAYRSKLGHLVKFLGESGQITQENINQFRDYLLNRETKRIGGSMVKGRLSKFTIRSILATTNHFLGWGSRAGYWPAIELHNIKEPRADPKAIGAATVTRLIEVASSMGQEWERARNLAILYVLRDSGCRVGAASSMELGHLDLSAGYALVPDKGDSISRLLFNSPTIAALTSWLHCRDVLIPRDDKVFTGARGWGLSRGGIYKVLRRLAKAAGITSRVNPHSFRHGFARDFITAGGELSQVSQELNHSSIVVTAKYYSRWDSKELQHLHKKYSPGAKLPIP